MFFSRCLLKRVKTQLRVPKMQRATFLNNIVTANTDFSENFIKKRYKQNLKTSIYEENWLQRRVEEARGKGERGRGKGERKDPNTCRV
ncbi:hypothetical protein NIES25_55370 (plasmid) [Nostoc linckia NIES-25]|nr:hypothetical protein NIES25_55370 [Nostoc linckia NIES-25]